MDIAGKHVVITGGSQGIGEKMADAFAAAGAKVLVVARSADKLQTVSQRIGGHSITADLTVAEDVDNLVARCVGTLGHIDIWINNAGMETTDAFLHMDQSVLRKLARLNFEAPLLLTRDVAGHMFKRGGGHIVQVSSVAGAIPFPGLTAYAGSKAGITNFTESLRLELKGTGIDLTVVAPGPVDTDMWDRLDIEGAYQTPALRRFRRLQFLPKIDPENVASATLAAVEKGKRSVRVPARFNMYHMLNNAPRRLVEVALAGVKMPKLSLDAKEISGRGNRAIDLSGDQASEPATAAKH